MSDRLDTEVLNTITDLEEAIDRTALHAALQPTTDAEQQAVNLVLDILSHIEGTTEAWQPPANDDEWFVVTISNTYTEQISVPIRAVSRYEAEQKGYEYDISGSKMEHVDSQVEVAAAPLAPDHEADPVGYGDGSRCKWCDKPVHWTGTDAKDSPTGKTIPGPWVHTE